MDERLLKEIIEKLVHNQKLLKNLLEEHEHLKDGMTAFKTITCVDEGYKSTSAYELDKVFEGGN